MTRSSRFLRGLSIGYVNMAAALVIGLCMTPFLLRHLGQADFGIWLIVTQVLSFLGLVDFGIVALLPRETAYALARASSVEASTELPELIRRTTTIVWLQLPLLIAACLLLLLFVPEGLREHRLFLAATLAAFVVRFPLRIYPEVLVGFQELAFVGGSQLVALAVSTVATAILVLSNAGLFSLVAGWTLLQVLPAVAAIVRLLVRYPTLFSRQLYFPRLNELRDLIGKGGWVSASQLAQVLVSGIDVIIIGRLLGPAAVVPYSVTGRLVGVAANAPLMVMQLAHPALSELKVASERERLFQISLSLMGTVLLLAGFFAALIVGANEGFVGWWIGSDYFGGHALSGVLIVAMVVRQVHVSVGYAVLCFGHERRLCLTALSEAGVGAVAALALVAVFGSIGAPIGALIGMCLIGLPLNLRVLASETGASLSRFASGLLPWLARCSVAVALAAVLAWIHVPRTAVELCLYGVVVGIAYAMLELRVALQPPLGYYLRPILENLTRRLRLPGRSA